jgi:hypothetical protein
MKKISIFLYFFLLSQLNIEAKKNIKNKNKNKNKKINKNKNKKKFKKIFHFNHAPITPITTKPLEPINEIKLLEIDIESLKQNALKKESELKDIAELKKNKEIQLQNLQKILWKEPVKEEPSDQEKGYLPEENKEISDPEESERSQEEEEEEESEEKQE